MVFRIGKQYSSVKKKKKKKPEKLIKHNFIKIYKVTNSGKM